MDPKTPSDGNDIAFSRSITLHEIWEKLSNRYPEDETPIEEPEEDDEDDR